jgi:hypothetical protein
MAKPGPWFASPRFDGGEEWIVHEHGPNRRHKTYGFTEEDARNEAEARNRVTRDYCDSQIPIIGVVLHGRGVGGMTEQNDVYAKILEVLQEGHANAIDATTIRIKCGFPKGRTEEYVRGVVREMVAQGIPVGSGRKGFFLITTPEDLERAARDYRARIRGLQQRLIDLNNAYLNYRKGKEGS